MFSGFFKNKRVLVTGNTGFKGAWLSIWLDELGAVVHGVSNCVLTKPSIFESLNLGGKIQYHQIDVRDSASFSKIVSEIQPDIVFHLAAQALVFDAYDNPLSTLATNVMGTANLLESLRVSNHSCLAVMITSDKCYENVEWHWGYRENDRLGGKDPYSASKACAELVIHTYFKSFFSAPDCPIRLVTARAGNVIGGGDWSMNRIVPDCIKAWTNGKSVEIRRPNSTRPWQHVLEPLSGYLRSAQLLGQREELSGESYNFGPHADQNYSVLRLLQELRTHWFEGREPFEPMKVSFDDSRPEAGLLKLCCDKALVHLDWRPTMAFAKTAQLTADWYKAFYSDGREDMDAFTRKQIREYCELATAKGNQWLGS